MQGTVDRGLWKTVAYRDNGGYSDGKVERGCCCLAPANARKFTKRALTHLGAEVQSVYSIICTEMNVNFRPENSPNAECIPPDLLTLRIRSVVRSMQTIQLRDGCWMDVVCLDLGSQKDPGSQGAKEPESKKTSSPRCAEQRKSWFINKLLRRKVVFGPSTNGKEKHARQMANES